MNGKTIALTSLFSLLGLLGNTGHADPHRARFRQLDDLSFAAFVEARELRWELHDDFVESQDYHHLLNDADELVVALHELQMAIYRERPEAFIGREVEGVQRKLSNLTQHLNGCDFARASESRHRTTNYGRGYVYHPATQHVGQAHVVAALKMVSRIEASLAQLSREVCVAEVHDHSPVRPPVVVPELPAPRPVSREMISRNNRTFEIPIGKPGAGGFVFRVGY